MRYLTLLFSTFLLSLLCSCAELKSIERYDTHTDLKILPENPLYLSVRNQTTNRKKQSVIDAKKLYAMKEGKRYAVQVKENEYTLQYASEWRDYFVSVTDPAPLPNDLNPHSWGTGVWTLHLEFADQPPRPALDASFKLNLHMSHIFVMPN